MKTNLTALAQKLATILKSKGYSDQDIPFLLNMYLGGELRGHTSHGLASFAAFANTPKTEQEEPVVIKETHALFALDAKGNNGNLIGKRAADEAIKRAKVEGLGAALIKDMDSWLRPGAIAEYIAEQGLVAVVTNSGGGTSIAPPGGFDPTVGTNPIAYGIPTTDDPLVVDMATAKHAWGQVRLANKYGTDLPKDAFYDNQGNITLDPKKAYSVKAAGDHKGYALALLVEILCGSLVGTDMMVESTAGSTFAGKLPVRGAFILVIDPGTMGDPSDFKQKNTMLIDAIKNSAPLPGQEIRIPGDHAAMLKAQYTKDDSIDIPDELWREIDKL